MPSLAKQKSPEGLNAYPISSINLLVLTCPGQVKHYMNLVETVQKKLAGTTTFPTLLNFRRRWLMGSLVLLALSSQLSLGWLTALGCNQFSDYGLVAMFVSAGSGLIFAFVGSLILYYRPDNRVGLLCLWTGIGLPTLAVIDLYIHCGLAGQLAAPGLAYLTWVTYSFGVVLIILPMFILLPMLYPNGQFLSSHWRRLTVAGLIIIAVTSMGMGLLPDFSQDNAFEAKWPVANPFGRSDLPDWWYPTFRTVLSLTVISLSVAGIVAMVVRWKRSVGDERQQMKWLAYFMATAVAVQLLVFELPGAFFYPQLFRTVWYELIILIVFWGYPLIIGIAVLKYRLYAVDLVINRTLVYGGLTAVIIVFYVVTVGSLSLLFHAQNNLLISLLATGLVAVFFQPIRERYQRAVNRLMFGERDDPYQVLSRLGRRLQETAVPDHLLPAITQTISQALKLPYVAVALHTADGERRLTALTGQPSTVTEEWPLLYRGELAGWLIVAPRSPQEQFTKRERQLLADIAGQAGAAAYAVRLTTALQRSRERLVLAGEEERRRIRRDLHDGLGPTLASQTFKLDAALELLATDPAAAANLLLSLKSQNQSLIAGIRRLVYALRPPSLDELGLLVALQVHISQMSLGNNGLKVTVAAAPDPLPPLPAAVEVAAYRIALEGLTNVVRHAQANQCHIFLELASASLIITIRDDGLGVSAGVRPGVGLTSMRERAEELGGHFVMTTNSGKGTQITATLPLLEVNKATLPQLPLVMGIITEAAAWLVAKGIDQWPSPPNDHWWRRIERYIANGELYLATLNGETIGTIRLTWSDPYWPTETNAGYVHTLAIRNQAHGLKIGTTLLLWAMDESRRQGKQFLRLDCPIHNQRIRAYYEELGFTFCRSVEDHDYAAALYEIELSGKP